jgi:uncharacterized protein with FMN-binding domain
MKTARRVLTAAGVLCALVALAGCAGWSAQGRAAYLNGITVSTPDLASKPDGTYNGSYTLKLPPGGMAAFRSITVDVTMGGGVITTIVITKPKDLAKGDFSNAIVAGPKGVIAKQSLDVDAVSGASYSSKAFLKAVENALSKEEVPQ